MNIDIRVAGTGEDLQKRLRLASGLLLAHKIRSTVRDWDGTRCDCVVVTGDDLFGQRVRAYAALKQIPVLTITRANDTFDPATNTIGDGAPLNLYVRAFLAILQAGDALSRARAPVASGEDRIGLLALSRALADREGDLLAMVDGIEVHILQSSGHVAARSQQDLEQAKDQLGSPGWQFRDSNGKPCDSCYFESLDIFMIRAGIRYGGMLPAFPVADYRLGCWPDLGTAPDLVDPLRIASLVAKGHRSLDELAGLTGIDQSQVSGILWGFRAASLLVPEGRRDTLASRPESKARMPYANVFQKLASRFGLFQKSW